MGEMADDLIDQIFGNWNLHEDAYYESRRTTCCRRCGTPFRWVKDEFENPVMMVEGEPHVCPAMVASASEFPEL